MPGSRVDPTAMDTTIEIQGTGVPAVGLGTWQITGPACVEAVSDALALGYRHIDTARAYRNEREVGEGIRASGVPRAHRDRRTDRDAVEAPSKLGNRSGGRLRRACG